MTDCAITHEELRRRYEAGDALRGLATLALVAVALGVIGGLL